MVSYILPLNCVFVPFLMYFYNFRLCACKTYVKCLLLNPLLSRTNLTVAWSEVGRRIPAHEFTVNFY